MAVMKEQETNDRRSMTHWVRAESDPSVRDCTAAREKIIRNFRGGAATRDCGSKRRAETGTRPTFRIS